MATIDTSIHESWPALDVQLVPLDQLIPYIRNPRQHSPEQIDQIAASMREFGWVTPVLQDEDRTILAGHGRVLAARKLEWEQAPVMTARGWSEAKKRAYVIADNKLALNASWDIDLLNAEIEALAEAEFPLDVLGFSDDDLSRMSDDLMSKLYTGVHEEGERAAADAKAANPAAEVTAPAAINPELVPLTIPMLVSQRQLIFSAIEKCKADYGLDQSAEAICQICQLFLEQQ